MNVDNNNPGSALSDESRVFLAYGGHNPKVYTTGDENAAIILAYDKVHSVDNKTRVYLYKYDNLDRMKANDSSENV